MLNRSTPLWLTLLAFVCLGWLVHANAAEPEQAELLVANPRLQHPLWGKSVLLVKSLEDGGHFGFILNKPTQTTLAQAFPDDEPSKKITQPLFIGGPQENEQVFALVEHHGGAPGNTIQITDDLFLAVRADAVDKVIESESDHARFFVGVVTWAPGELESEIDRGLWYEADAEAKVVLQKKTDGQWEELVRWLQMRERAI